MLSSQMDVFTVGDLRNHTGVMIRKAQEGGMAIITKGGRPMVLTLPFDRRLLELGVGLDLALFLFENGVISIKKAARVADMTLDAFMDVLAESNVPAVNYPPEELDAEMKVLI